MNAPIMFMPVGQDRVVARLAAALLEDGASASIVAPEGAGKTAVLERLASELAGGQARIVRVACPHVGGLSLPALLSQVIGRVNEGVLSNEDLELASDLLTQADTSCSLIALLVDDAHDLLPPALRYIQFACMSGPLLRVVLAGRPGTLELLRGDEFGYLRRRISRNVQLPPLSATTRHSPALIEDAPAVRAPVAAPPPARRRGPAWALAGLGIAASVTVAAYLDRQDAPPAPMAASVAPGSAPMLDTLAAPRNVSPSVTLAEAPPAMVELAMPGMTAAAELAEDSPPVLAEAAPEPVTQREAAGLLPQPSPDAPTLVETVQPAPEPSVAVAEPGPADAAATPREAAGLLPQPSPGVGTAFVEAAQPAPEHAGAEVVPEQAITAAKPIPADVATPREIAALQSQPSPEPPITAVELPVAPPASEQAATDAPPEPLTAGAAVTAASLDPAPAMAEAALRAEPSEPEPVVADAAPAQEPAAADAPAEPPAAVAELPAAPFAPEPPAIAAVLVEPPAQEPAVADVAPAPLQPEASSAPAMADLPVPPVPVPAPAVPVAAMPEAPRRAVTRPARVGPERVAAYDARADERRCRDIVLRAQLGEDITNADRQFLRGGCRAGR